MVDLWTVLQLFLVGIFLYYFINKKYSYWSNKKVPGPKPIFPFGYIHERAIYRPDDIELRMTENYGRVYGCYTGLVPTLTITDAELIKQVLVKDFHLYLNRRKMNPFHEIWNLNMFVNEDANWKRIRSITTPAFTSGKLRSMYPIMGQCIERLDQFFKKTAQRNGLFDTKEVMAGFTIDVIAQSAFATITNANDDRAKQNPFVYHGLNLFKFNPAKLMACLSMPRPILKLLNFTTFFPADSFQFFVDLTSQIVEQRKANLDKKNNDLIQLMIDSFTYEEDLVESNYNSLAVSMDSDNVIADKTADSTKTKKQMTTKEIIAQCILFFIAGFETTASTLTHALFEFAHQPEIQERLLEEIELQLADIDPKNRDKYYDALINNCTLNFSIRL